MFDFSGKVILITGAAGNLGSALVGALAQAGAELALFEARPDRLERIVEGLADPDRAFLPGAVDVTDPASVAAAVEKVVDRLGRIDALINIAGGYQAGQALHETSLETWDHMMDLNARSVFILSRAVVPHMLAQGSGAIVNVGARPGLKGVAKASAYSAAKSAVIRITESLSAEVKHSGINVNCILPGTIDTPQNRQAMPDGEFDRWVKPEKIGDVIQFLISDAARAIHGATIPVYGTS